MYFANFWENYVEIHAWLVSKICGVLLLHIGCDSTHEKAEDLTHNKGAIQIATLADVQASTT